jgi:Domain of unknown function (DUF5615)
MPLRFVLDENQRGPLWRAILRHNQIGTNAIDAVRVGDSDDLPLRATDPDILDWCEREGRILVTFDKATLAEHHSNHLQAGRHCPGIFTLRRGTRLPQIVEHLALVSHASGAWDWADRIEFIP